MHLRVITFAACISTVFGLSLQANVKCCPRDHRKSILSRQANGNDAPTPPTLSELQLERLKRVAAVSQIDEQIRLSQRINAPSERVRARIDLRFPVADYNYGYITKSRG